MSLIKELAKVTEAGQRAYKDAKAKPLFLQEERGPLGAKENIVCRGDNKTVMKTLLDDYDMKGKLKLIYIDPPFFSKANYDAVVTAGDAKLHHRAYADKWEKGMAEYLKMLCPRLYLMKDLLAEDGLIWLHLDWHVVHYAKILMDEIFGEKNFVNEIIWTYKSGGSSKKHFARKHDTILVYSKGAKYSFYPLLEKSYNRQFKPYRFKGVKEYKDDTGWYTMVNMKDVWNIDMVGRTSAERTGYATQKPEALMERIVESCSKPGDICADFFCGSGSLPVTAARMGRKIIACDMGSLAVESTINRLAEQGSSFGVYSLKEAPAPVISVKVDAVFDPIPSTDKLELTIELRSLRIRGISKIAPDKDEEIVKQLLKEDSLSLIQSWSVDYHSRDDVHRPTMTFARTRGHLATSCQAVVTGDEKICIKVVDIFGNVAYERIEYERKD